jgi:hypothetical protein
MHYTQCASEQYANCVYTDLPAVEDQFVTEPIIAVEPVYRQLNEEELHTLFEQAISDRVVVVSARLKRISSALNDCLPVSPETTSQRMHQAPVEVVPLNWLPDSRERTRSLSPNRLWQRSFIVASLALMFLLTGFDLMGVLVLYMR